MSAYDNLDQFKESSPKEKLMILGNMSVVPLSAIKGYITLIKYNVEVNKELPENFFTWLDKIAEATDNLQKLLALTRPSSEE